MKFLLKLVGLLLLVPGCAFAQQITITGQVKDPNGVPYTNGRGRAILTPTNVFFTTGLTNPVPGSQSPVIIDGLDANGKFTVVLTSTAAIDQQTSSPQWLFTFCSAPILQFGPICFSGPILALSSSQDITTQISAVPPPVLPGGGTGGAPPAPPAGALQKASSPPSSFSASAVSEPPTGNLAGALSVGEDVSNKGPNPWVDIRTFGGRAFLTPAQQTTANCNGTTSVTLSGAIDFINGDGIVLHQCGPPASLSTPAAPSTVTPKGILNGTTTRCYKIVAEDQSLGMTAASPSTCTSAAASAFGTTLVTLSSCTSFSGTLSCTTSANHNFEIGERIRISSTVASTPAGVAGVNGIFYVQTTPSATTFTATTAFKNRPELSFPTTGGTVEAPAHVWVKFTFQLGTLRYWIYRQDGGVGNFNLVGVAQGEEPFFDDYNFTAPFQSPEVPSTSPAVATNQALATKIVSGAGTTSIVVANSASNTISGIAALHDDTVAWIAATNAAFNNGGGAVFVPNPGVGTLSYLINFPLILPTPFNNTTVKHYIASYVTANQPLLPSSATEIIGYGTFNGGQPSFGSAGYAPIAGPAYPIMYVYGKNGVTLDHLNVSGQQHQQWAVLMEGGSNLYIRHSYLGGQFADSIPAVLRKASFGFHSEDTVFSENGVAGPPPAYFYAAGLRLMGSIVGTNGTFGQGGLTDVTFIGAGVSVDGDSAGGVGPNTWAFSRIFSESACAPIFQARNWNGSWFNWSIDNFEPADTLGTCGQNPPLIDFSNPTVGNIVGLSISPTNSGNLGGTGSVSAVLGPQVFGVRLVGSSAQDIYNISNSYAAPVFTVASNYLNGTATNQTFFETSGGVRLMPPAPIFVQGNAPTGMVGVIQAGGSLAAGTNTLTATAVDWNGGESAQSQEIFVTVTPGNQTIAASWVAPTGPAPASYNVYYNSTRANLTPILGTSFTFSTSPTSISPPFSFGGGPVGMSSATGMWTYQTRYTSGQFKTDVSAGTLTANRSATWPDSSGTVTLNGAIPVYSTVSATTGAGIGTTTMVTAGGSGNKYIFNATAAQVAGGTSCTGNSTVQLFVNYTDAVTNAAQVPTLGGYSIANSTFAGNGAPVLAVTNGAANAMAINWNPMTINAKANTTVSYGTTYTIGTGCSPAPTYYVTPSLVQIQ